MNFLMGSLALSGSKAVLRLADGLDLDLGAGRIRGALAEGHPIVLGVRPEHIRRAGAGQPGSNIRRLEAEVELIQPTGSRTYVTLRLGGLPVVAEMQAHDVAEPNMRLEIDIDLGRSTLFDAKTEEAI
jgi:multiple sugar transport system ATP-binding protein